MKEGNDKILEEVKFESYKKSIPELLDKLNFKNIIKKEKKIILKPNLTLYKKFPTTTNVDFVEEIIKYIRKHNKNSEIIIAEGSGGDKTEECFKKLGYIKLGEKFKIPLIDLNNCDIKKINKKDFKKFSFINYPKPLLSGFLISLPVLKEHSEAKVTISLKNMLGAFQKNKKENWKNKMHQWQIGYAIHDILVCKFPDLAICDASIAQSEHEIYGNIKKFNLLFAGSAFEVDKCGAQLLRYDWKSINHLNLTKELLNKKLK